MSKSKKDLLIDEVAKAVGAGREVSMETVDFSDSNRPKTCLEVDFPIIPINKIAAIEGKGSGALKPVYQVMKWWARRRSTVFRQLLISAVLKAPDDDLEAGKIAWDAYYSNHQKNGSFKQIKVADIFMGGGTTIVEGSRLGLKMFGNDLNPVAWFVVNNAISDIDAGELINLSDYVEENVKPQIMPFYACDCPRGHKGRWLRFSDKSIPIKPINKEQLFSEPNEAKSEAFMKSVSSFDGWSGWYRDNGYEFDIMDDKFDPLKLTYDERPFYRYWGPETIYTFWAKHAPCQVTGCGHLTPIVTSPVVAIKSVTIQSWLSQTCGQCNELFDIDKVNPRMAPGAPLVISTSEKPFATLDENGNYSCPYCGYKSFKNVQDKQASKKRIELTLFVHPDWVKGTSAKAECSGSAKDPSEARVQWNELRASSLRLVEVRGESPEEVQCPETGLSFKTGKDGGNVPKRSQFICQEPTCGREQDVLTAIKESGKAGPFGAYAIRGYCPDCDSEGYALNGDFFDKPATEAYKAAIMEWESRKTSDLLGYWPQSEIPFGFMTGMANGDIRKGHGFTHWWTMFNPRQLLVLSQLLKAIENSKFKGNTKEALLGAFQQYLRNQNMFCFWNFQRALEPLFANNNYHPKSQVVENTVFSGRGRGDFASCVRKIFEQIKWTKAPWEIACGDQDDHSVKVETGDPVINTQQLDCGSSTDLNIINNDSIDLVITDPPFGGLLHYSELSDFFYVWLRLALKETYPNLFTAEYTPKSLEAVANEAREEEPENFYKRVLTQCWNEVFRILKPGGILAFTFHHSEDEPWVAVLESLFDSGFYLEATYPIRSDETKGEGQFGSKQIEYDIIHVCRKRTEEPTPVSWARMRRQVMSDVQYLQALLENHINAGLPAADLQVIKRGKALEYYSRHYGKVYIEEGRGFTVREALVGINQLLDEEWSSTTVVPPNLAEPLTRQFLRIFYATSEVPRDQMQKYLKGTGVTPSAFEAKGWCKEVRKVFLLISPLDIALIMHERKHDQKMYDYDQAMYLIGASFEGSGIKVDQILNDSSFKPHPALSALLDWFYRYGGTQDIKTAASRAKQLYTKWESRNQAKVQVQMALFDIHEGDE